jgi:tetratricopeptide (TPR) repeat protein
MMRVLFVFILLLPFIANAQSKKNYLRNGNDLYQDSMFNEAEMKYRKSLEKDQDYFPASYNLADAIYKQERFEESANLFDALTDNAKDKNEKAKIYHNLGNSLLKQQKIKESIAAYKDALRNSPTDEDTRHNLALAQKMLQQQQQEKEENQESKEGNKKEEQKENKQKEEKGEQKKDQQQEKEEMSKEAAEKMLKALDQQERELQKKLQKKKVKGKKVNVLKDW